MNKRLKKVLVVGGCAAGVAACTAGVIVAAPLAVAAAGFGSAGVAAGSIAAAVQSSAYGGPVVAGFIFSLLQSAGSPPPGPGGAAGGVAVLAMDKNEHEEYKQEVEKVYKCSNSLVMYA